MTIPRTPLRAYFVCGLNDSLAAIPVGLLKSTKVSNWLELALKNSFINYPSILSRAAGSVVHGSHLGLRWVFLGQNT